MEYGTLNLSPRENILTIALINIIICIHFWHSQTVFFKYDFMVQIYKMKTIKCHVCIYDIK